MPQLRIKNLSLACEQVQTTFWQLCLQPNDTSAQKLHERIAQLATQIETMCTKANSTPAALPAPSRRAYAWLNFLSTPHNFAQHMRTLNTLQTLLAQHKRIAEWAQAGNTHRVELGLTQLIFHTQIDKRNRTVLHFGFAEGFVWADTTVLHALVQAAAGKSKTHLQTVRAFALSSPFTQLAAQLELATDGTPSRQNTRTQGAHYDLQIIFERVNHTHFANELPRPTLRWNRTKTARIMGHYQQRTDTVTLSQTLDDPRVPEFVIDFVMYHELLHKQLGARVSNSAKTVQRRVHFKDFREAERAFPRYAEANAFLNQFASKLANAAAPIR